MDSAKERWLDQDAGPVVRLYAITKGRTSPSGDAPLGLIDLVVATGRAPDHDFRPGPEHRRLLRMCGGRAVTVVDLAADIDLPLAVLRVLLSDLSALGMIKITSMTAEGQAANQRLLRDLLDGLRAL